VGVSKSEGLSKSQLLTAMKDTMINKIDVNLFRRKIVNLGLRTLFIWEREIHSF
jgi:hypothetical protein